MQIRSVLASIAAAAVALLAPAAALAHPHVWVSAKAELIYGPEGKVASVRHHWTFDEGYSAVAVQGLDANGDGKLSSDELAELAKTNTTSLVEFGYFTSLKANGAKQGFASPRAERMTYERGQLTLSFELPLGREVSGRMVVLDVYDPTFFVDFRIADGDDAIKLAGAPAGCALKITRPKPATDQGKQLDEGFFQNLPSASTFAAQYSGRALAICP